ncbi:MAG: hypothetical protein IJ056_02390 [Acidaminococcaceae bacterium]|nr:hypothetical protein [Acidaminococcaceae bacterium]
MQFKKPYANKYLSAAIAACLLSAMTTSVPVSAEEILKEDVHGQETAVEQMSLSAPPSDVNVQEPGLAQSAEESAENSDVIDHSAESKPIQNEFLKEGEGIPGTEVPYHSEKALTSKEWAEIDKIEKEIRQLQRQRQEFFKARDKEKAEKEKAFAKSLHDRQKYSIVFDPEDYTAKTMNANGEPVSFRAYEHLVYTKKPYEPEYQMLSVYIPEGYFKGESINGFTAETAPIFMPNGVGGYMPGTIIEPQEDSRHGGANSALYALSNGYVVVSPAIRGQSLKNKDGYATGKAPALIVDYKAAVRFVRHNRKKGRIPAGDTDKIIASGTSAGGALSALLGASGNAKEYLPYLKEQGAANERDDIFAVMAYCPITNLEHADMSYEWMFQSANSYYNAGPANTENPDSQDQVSPAEIRKNRPPNAPKEKVTGTKITPEQKEISAELSQKFTEYLNSLNLRDSIGNRLNLSPDGLGLFREYIESLYLASAQEAMDRGDTIKNAPWLTVENGTAVHMDFPKYIKSVKRLKGIPAFDAFDMSSGENSEFGTYDVANKHFTRYALEHSNFVTIPRLEEEAEINKEKATLYRLATPIENAHLRKANLEEQMEKDKLDLSQYMANWEIIRMMNPMHFIGLEEVQTAPNWRIRHGALDRDTAVAIPAMLALRLKNTEKSVDFKVPWGYGHDGDYDLPDLFAWTDRISKIKDAAQEILKSEKNEASAKENVE